MKTKNEIKKVIEELRLLKDQSEPTYEKDGLYLHDVDYEQDDLSPAIRVLKWVIE